MAYWWVNHKQTFRHEFNGGYIWSPKRKSDGSRNVFYDFMRMVKPHDVIFSYASGVIRGAGFAKTHCYTSPRPDEFGHIGFAWDAVGWRVDVSFVRTEKPLAPRDILGEIDLYIGVRYSPLNKDGTGRQSVYLAAIPDAFGMLLADKIGLVESSLQNNEREDRIDFELGLPGVIEWENIERQKIEAADIPETDRKALIHARVGQGRFKANVARFEKSCRVTRVTNPTHLIASHIKPWRESNNEERLSAGNGLLLTPSIDHLFDRGFISFEDNGDTLISPIADKDSLYRMGVDPANPPRVGVFNQDQRFFLNHHRESVFLKDVG